MTIIADVHEATLTAPLAGLGAFTSASSTSELNLGYQGVAVSGCVRAGSPNFLPAALSDNEDKVVVPPDAADAAASSIIATTAADASTATDAAATDAASGETASGDAADALAELANSSDANASGAVGVGNGWGGFSGDELGAVLLGGLVPLAALPLASPMWQARHAKPRLLLQTSLPTPAYRTCILDLVPCPHLTSPGHLITSPPHHPTTSEQAPIFAAYNWLFDTSKYVSAVDALVGSDLPHLGRDTPLCRATFLASGQTLPGTLRSSGQTLQGGSSAEDAVEAEEDGVEAGAVGEASGEVAATGTTSSAKQLEVVADPLFPPMEAVAAWLERLGGSGDAMRAQCTAQAYGATHPGGWSEARRCWSFDPSTGRSDEIDVPCSA